jgi:hypothetical protein
LISHEFIKPSLSIFSYFDDPIIVNQVDCTQNTNCYSYDNKTINNKLSKFSISKLIV